MTGLVGLFLVFLSLIYRGGQTKLVVIRRTRGVFAFGDEIWEVQIVGIMAEKRLLLGKTSGVLNESCEVFLRAAWERGKRRDRGGDKRGGWRAHRQDLYKKIPRCLPDSGGMSFAARIAGRVTRSGFSTWRRRTMSCSQCYLSFFSWPNRMVQSRP